MKAVENARRVFHRLSGPGGDLNLNEKENVR